MEVKSRVEKARTAFNEMRNSLCNQSLNIQFWVRFSLCCVYLITFVWVWHLYTESYDLESTLLVSTNSLWNVAIQAASKNSMGSSCMQWEDAKKNTWWIKERKNKLVVWVMSYEAAKHSFWKFLIKYWAQNRGQTWARQAHFLFRPALIRRIVANLH